ncbi:unnamed protein product [Mortierella alpina]
MKSPLTILLGLTILATITFADQKSALNVKSAAILASADPTAYVQTSSGLAMRNSAFRDVPSAKNVTDDEMQSILDTHNGYRRMHGSPDLTWNDAAATWGDNWLQSCEFRHSDSGPNNYEEILAAGYADFKSAIDAWYGEVKDYDYNSPGFSMNTGHFTQVVWKSTTSIGCAKRECPRWTIYICNYDPAGNIISDDNSYFTDNVLPSN